jgi:hypothetical protein
LGATKGKLCSVVRNDTQRRAMTLIVACLPEKFVIAAAVKAKPGAIDR